MIKYIVTLLSIALCYGQEFLISDYNFTNQEYSINDIHKFLKKYPRNKLTDDQIWFGYWQCRAWTIHPLMWLSMMEKESSTVSNPISLSNLYKWREHRCMGYGLIKNVRVKGKKYYLYGFYPVQVHQGIKCLRKWFDDFKIKRIIKLNEGLNYISPKNAATYSLCRYTPYTISNESFIKIYKKFKNNWKCLK